MQVEGRGQFTFSLPPSLPPSLSVSQFFVPPHPTPRPQPLNALTPPRARLPPTLSRGLLIGTKDNHHPATHPPPTQPFHRPPPGSKTCERETAAVALLCHAHQFIHKSNPMDLLTSIRFIYKSSSFIFPQQNQSEITSSKWNEEK